MKLPADNPDGRILAEPAPECGEHAYRCKCEVCERDFILNMGLDARSLVVCPSCSTVREPTMVKAGQLPVQGKYDTGEQER